MENKHTWEEGFYMMLNEKDDYYSQVMYPATTEEPNPPRFHYLQVSGAGYRLDDIVNFFRQEIDLAVKRREGELRKELVMRVEDMTKNPLLTQSGERAGIEAELDSLKRFILSLLTHKE